MQRQPTPARRTPVQERSSDTVQSILEATSRLLGKTPIAEISTSRIAQEADVSIGGLYRFFPDKQAVIDAVAVKHVEDFQKTVAGRLAEIDAVNGPGLLNLMIDAYVEFLDGRPDFRAIALGRHVSALTREQQLEPGAGPAELVKMFMIGGMGMDAKDLDLKLRIAIEAGERLIDFAFSQPDAAGRARVIGELKGLLAKYLFS